MGVFLERCSLGLLGPGEGRGLLKPLLFIKGLCMHLFHSARQPPVPVSPLQQAWAPRAQKHPWGRPKSSGRRCHLHASGGLHSDALQLSLWQLGVIDTGQLLMMAKFNWHWPAIEMYCRICVMSVCSPCTLKAHLELCHCTSLSDVSVQLCNAYVVDIV